MIFNTFAMNDSLCAALLTLLPVLLLVGIVESRATEAAVKGTNLYNIPTGAAVAFSLLGIALSIYGVQAGGLKDHWAFAAWVFLGGSFLATVVLSLLLLRTYDHEDLKIPETETETEVPEEKPVRRSSQVTVTFRGLRIHICLER